MNKKTFHFISGLPRSGSTLLSSILNQNPEFYAGVTTPVWSLITSLLPRMSGASEFSSFFDDNRRRSILRGVFDNYYHDKQASIVFDTNRLWTSRISLILDLFPDALVICLVRDIPSILESFDRVLQDNPLQLPRGSSLATSSNIYSRVDAMMHSQTGVVGAAWTSLRDAWFGRHASRITIVNYSSLATDPKRTVARLYELLGVEHYTHDFNRVSYDQVEYDNSLGLPGLHRVRNIVEMNITASTIPPDIAKKYDGYQFWLRKSDKPEAATVI